MGNVNTEATNDLLVGVMERQVKRMFIIIIILIADLTNQLNQANNAAINGAQSQYLLSQMGKWVANAPAATT